MVDIALQLQAQTPGQRSSRSRAAGCSRTRIASAAPRPAQGVPVPDPTTSLIELLRFVRTAAVVAEVGGGDWRDAVNALRPVTSELWAALPASRAAALRRPPRALLGRPPPPPRAARSPRPSSELRESGRLTFASGRIRSVADHRRRRRGDRAGARRRRRRARCAWRPSSTARDRPATCAPAARACSRRSARPGPSARTRSRSVSTRAPTAPCATRADAQPETLFALGPLRRGELWESTAVPEIRAQAHALAQHLAQRALAGRAPRGLR